MSRSGSRFTWRMAFLAVTMVAMAIGLVVRLVFIQIVNHENYVIAAQDEHYDKRLVRANRGAILDRNGFPLATSLDVFDIYIDRRAWHGDYTKAQQVALALAPRLNQNPNALLGRLIDDSRGKVELFESGVDFAIGKEIEKLYLPGITLAGGVKRAYPEGDIGSTLLGFLGREHTGLAGSEADYEDVLGGSPGSLFFEKDGVGRPIAFGRSQFEPGTPGSDIRLTIDRYIQRLVENELDFQLQAHKASGGSIIVMEPKTGAILAMASRPSFKLSELSLQAANLDLYRNRAVADLYEPGSVVKTLTMAAALDLDLVNPNTTYVDNGLVIKGGYEFKNWDFTANGVQTMTQLLQKSLNTGAIWLSDQVGATRLYEYFKRFGFGESTHSGMGGEADGLVRTNKAADWYPADLATNSYGQGIAATPLQVITAISSLINGGNLMRPYIVQEVDGPNDRRVFEPVVVRRAISPKTSQTMVKMMNDVVDGVPFHRAQVKGYHVGGKTGTTLVSIPTGYALDSTLATFVGFAPVEDPAMIMLIKIDQPQDDPLGGIVAAPVFGKLAPSILSYLNIRPAGTTPVARSAP
ncbi:MAG TPA: penicillin-binding protein 2 [Dehalococcoidia bacterium]|nr:penicillin-binding protein 2 [Dehalococcoidia bacterium]